MKPLELHIIVGMAGVGKTTFAENLSEDILGVVMNVSKPIKEIAYLQGWNGEKDPQSRSLLQRIGRQGREISPYAWVGQLISDIVKYRVHTPLRTTRVVIPDVRLDDEIDILKSTFPTARFYVYKLEREGFVSPLTKEQLRDVTEKGVSDKYVTKKVKLKAQKSEHKSHSTSS